MRAVASVDWCRQAHAVDEPLGLLRGSKVRCHDDHYLAIEVELVCSSSTQFGQAFAPCIMMIPMLVCCRDALGRLQRCRDAARGDVDNGFLFFRDGKSCKGSDIVCVRRGSGSKCADESTIQQSRLGAHVEVHCRSNCSPEETQISWMTYIAGHKTGRWALDKARVAAATSPGPFNASRWHSWDVAIDDKIVCRALNEFPEATSLALARGAGLDDGYRSRLPWTLPPVRCRALGYYRGIMSNTTDVSWQQFWITRVVTSRQQMWIREEKPGSSSMNLIWVATCGSLSRDWSCVAPSTSIVSWRLLSFAQSSGSTSPRSSAPASPPRSTPAASPSWSGERPPRRWRTSSSARRRRRRARRRRRRSARRRRRRRRRRGRRRRRARRARRRSVRRRRRSGGGGGEGGARGGGGGAARGGAARGRGAGAARRRRGEGEVRRAAAEARRVASAKEAAAAAASASA